DDEQVGVYEINLTVIDSHDLSATQTLTITIYNVNDPPEFTSTAVTIAPPGSGYEYIITATDPDYIHGEESLTITALTTLPSWLTLGSTSYDSDGTWTAVLSGTPGIADVGDHPVKLKVTDFNGASAEQSFTVRVRVEQDDFSIYLPLIQR
ncbi:MAG: putative Ig domain-containing protein, partial [Brevefilum sp.]|nr:putative Ig domain-containing protein [Brevefilum sp.]